MASSDLESKAKEAFIDDHFELAVSLYSQAIDICPDNADLYIDRAQAYIKLNSFTDAVADANKAIELDPKLAKAYLRKGSACFKLDEYQTAKAALETGAALAPGDSRFTNLIKECELKIAEESGDVSERSPGVAHQPEPVTSGEAVNPTEPPSVQAVTTAAKPKYRHAYFQKPEEVVVEIFAKCVPPSSIKVAFGEQILSVHIEIPDEEAYHFQPRLFAKIVPAKCKYEVLATKVEIRLAKAEPIHWTSLEFTKETAVTQKINVSTAGQAQRPAYPSSKPKQVDWDKLEAQVKKEEKEEKLDGEAGLNKFFAEIYQGADEDTRRAMQKSFLESNGTVLSTNWKEVGKGKVEGSPPDGMEMKKWEY
uniref:Protein SGT1 homolog n=1 Tax=Kalanchoe fedtschenkoi TaxID=63787 RepID=A0A7N0U648_KALFE